MMLTEVEERLMLEGAIKSISKLPPLDDIQDVKFWTLWERVPFDIKIAAKTHWKWIGRYLDAYFRKESDPLPESGESEINQAIIRNYARYYLAFYDVLFNAEYHIKAEAKRRNIRYPFKCVGDLFYGVVYEDFLTSLEPCGNDHWESLPASVELEAIKLSGSFWRGEKINSQAATRLEKEIKKVEKLQASCGQWSFWNIFCREVFAKYRSELQSPLVGLGNAYSDIYRLWSSHKSPACDRLRKIIFINGTFRESPIGKNRRKSLT